jgi:DNA replication protein DnaC
MNDPVTIRLEEHCDYLGLSAIKTQLESLLEEAARSNLGYRDFLVQLLDRFDFTFQPSIDRNRIKELVTLRFLAHGENVIILGPPGVGKTHLAIALGVAACQQGECVCFSSAEELISSLRAGHEKHRLRERLRYFMRPRLLIIDEFGYLPIDRLGANLMFQLIAQRYERGAVIITSNRSYGEWGEVLGDNVVAAAILDRLLHHSVTINIKGESYRLKEKRKAGILTRPNLESTIPVEGEHNSDR